MEHRLHRQSFVRTKDLQLLPYKNAVVMEINNATKAVINVCGMQHIKVCVHEYNFVLFSPLNSNLMPFTNKQAA